MREHCVAAMHFAAFCLLWSCSHLEYPWTQAECVCWLCSLYCLSSSFWDWSRREAEMLTNWLQS